MVTPEEIKKKAALQYKQYLSSYYSHTMDTFFPLLIRCDKKMDFPSAREMEKSMTRLQNASDEMCSYGYTIEYVERTTRMYEVQNVPNKIYFKSERDFLKYIGKEKDTADFHSIMENTLREFPELKDTMVHHYRQVVENKTEWEQVLMVCRFFRINPEPNKFVRELPIGVHTKFVETHRDILRPLLDVILADGHIDQEASSFYGRYHLKEGDPTLSFRMLDSEMSERYMSGFTYSTVYVCEFARCSMPVKRVIIVENKRNLSQIIELIPSMPSTIVIWGSGYKVNVLKYVEWLKDVDVIYWGDIDAQGYEILSNIRTFFPNIRSVLMNDEALRMNPTKVEGTQSDVTKLLNLTDEEMKVYEYVKQNVLRYEQEQLPETYVLQILKEIDD